MLLQVLEHIGLLIEDNPENVPFALDLDRHTGLEHLIKEPVEILTKIGGGNCHGTTIISTRTYEINTNMYVFEAFLLPKNLRHRICHIHLLSIFLRSGIRLSFTENTLQLHQLTKVILKCSLHFV